MRGRVSDGPSDRDPGLGEAGLEHGRGAVGGEDVVAWAWQNEWGGKVFGTTFGHPGDFAEESFVRMLVNSVCWAVDRPFPGGDETITTWKIQRADKKRKK